MEKVVIVNKYGPSSKSITGRSARALADELISRGHLVSFVSLDAEYKKKEKIQQSDFQGRSLKLRSWYNGTKPMMRLLFSLLDGFRLIAASNRLDVDHRIVMTDPPLLYFWTTFFRRRFKSEIYWTMDLYPEAFVSGSYISKSNILYKYIFKRIYRNKPDLIIALGSKQAQYLEEKFQNSIPKVILPCGIIEFNINRAVPSWRMENIDKIVFGYGGNISEAHDAIFLKSFINNLNEDSHRIILSLYGSKKAEVMSGIKNQSVVLFSENISYHDQHFIDVNIASLLPEWDNVCVPSKAVTAVSCHSSLLLNSSINSEAWNMFKECSWLIEAGCDYDQSIKEFLSALSKEEIIDKRSESEKAAYELAAMEKEAYNQLDLFIKSH